MVSWLGQNTIRTLSLIFYSLFFFNLKAGTLVVGQRTATQQSSATMNNPSVELPICASLCLVTKCRWLGEWLLANNPNKPLIGQVDDVLPEDESGEGERGAAALEGQVQQ